MGITGSKPPFKVGAAPQLAIERTYDVLRGDYYIEFPGESALPNPLLCELKGPGKEA